MRTRFLLHDAFAAGGGVVTVTFDLAAALARRGHRVSILSVFGEGEPVHPFPEGVEVRSLVPRRPPPWRPRTFVHAYAAARRPSSLVSGADPRHRFYDGYTDEVLTQALSSMRAGSLVTMQPALSILTARLGARTPLRVVTVAQEHRPFHNRPPQLHEEYRAHVRGLDAFLTLTRVDARRYRALLGEDVVVRAIPNGMPSGDGPISSCAHPVVVAAGRLSRSKGFDILVDAWVHVARAHPEWELRIFGEGELQDELSARIVRRGLQGKVRLMGFSTRLRHEMAQASIFALSSRSEGYPRVILEAMAAGLPVVSTACPTGPREMVTPEVDGLLVPNMDPDALGTALRDLIERGADARRALGRAGRDRSERHSQAAVAERWDDLLSRLARRRRHHRAVEHPQQSLTRRGE